MAGHPGRNLSVPRAVSQSGRATCEKSQRGYPTAITSATSVTANLASQQYKLMLGRHDNHDALELRPVTIGAALRCLPLLGRAGASYRRGESCDCARRSQRRLRKLTGPWTRCAVRGERRRGNQRHALISQTGLRRHAAPFRSSRPLPQPSRNLHSTLKVGKLG
jgi:hypothetical protein